MKKFKIKYRVKHLVDAWFNKYYYTYSTRLIMALNKKKAAIKGRPKYAYESKVLSIVEIKP